MGDGGARNTTLAFFFLILFLFFLRIVFAKNETRGNYAPGDHAAGRHTD